MTESQRALELRKFFAPFEDALRVNEVLLGDGALDAYAEKVLWRNRATRCQVSLVDNLTQYFIAGVTRDHAESQEVRPEHNWFGCHTVETPGGLCENVLAVKGKPDEYPCFQITDLSKDPRFAQLSVIDGTVASMRFYAGTPITTRNGINIGSFFLFSNEPRPEGLTLEERKTLFQTAANIMRHLEAKREAVERRRIALMSGGVARFLEKANELTELRISPPTTDEAAHSTVNDSSANGEKSSQETPELSLDTSQSSTISISNDGGIDDEVQPKKEGASEIILGVIRKTLDHAAEILRESLELTSGGVVFFDTAIRYAEPRVETDYFDLGHGVSQTGMERNEDRLWQHSTELDSPDGEDLTMTGFAGIDPRTANSPEGIRSYHDEKRPARVLAMSTSKHSYKRSKILNGKTLNHFINEYPKGNVWYIDDKGYFSSLDQMEHLSSDTGKSGLFGRKRSVENLPTMDLTRQAEEALLLSQVFPKARQIIFLPLWDARGNRWHSGCFVFSEHAFPVFTVESELSYISALSNSVMVEISRLDSIVANNMKSDFISSISHEFRSPLHGILASAEFLQDSELDQTQKELVSTVQTCGSTLLDTINHVLDYSKINSFEKQKGSTGAISNELDSVSNVALLCEDIVCGVIAARNFGDSTGHRDSSSSPPSAPNPVTIILDFEKTDFNFSIQPGALRRIALNLIGNSQKYTDRGFILVQLRIRDRAGKAHTPLKPNQKMLIMNIIDSGRGMSTTFLERRMGQPFSQENSFAPGIGLGMAIVKSIVKQLGGKINVRSQLGVGTDIEVMLPLDMPSGPDNGAENTSPELLHHRNSAGQIDMNAVQSVENIRNIAPGKTVAFWRRTDIPKDRNKDLAWKSVVGYCKAWFGFTILDGQDAETLESADLVLKEFSEEDADGSSAVNNLRIKRLLFLQETLSAVTVRRSTLKNTANILMPVGPFRLARIIGLLFPTSSAHSTEAESEIDPLQHIERIDSNATVTGPSPNVSDNISNSYNSANGDANTLRNNSDDPYSDLSTSPASFHAAQSPMFPPIGNMALEMERRDSLASEAENQWADAQLNMLPQRSQSAMGGLINKRPKRPKTHTQTSLPTHTLGTVHAHSKSMSTEYNLPQETRPLNILAVDDNALNLKLLTRYLAKRTEDTVVMARDGVEAVAAVKRAHDEGKDFDVIFMDISMPTMDGFEATRHIRQWEKEIRTRRLAETLKLPTSITRILGDEGIRQIADADISTIPPHSVTTPSPLPEGAERDLFSAYLTLPQLSTTSSSIKIPIRGLSGTALGHVVVGSDSGIEAATQKTVQELQGDRGAFIVALTGLASRRDRDEAVASGFDDFMTKPISFGMIGDLLGKLGGRGSRRLRGGEGAGDESE